MRDLLGIRKDWRDAKKAGLEIEKLKKEAEARDARIQSVSADDIQRYDPKVQRLVRQIYPLENRLPPCGDFRASFRRLGRILLIVAILLLVAASLFFWFYR